MSLIQLNSTPRMEHAILDGRKLCTTHMEPKGEPGVLSD